MSKKVIFNTYKIERYYKFYATSVLFANLKHIKQEIFLEK